MVGLGVWPGDHGGLVLWSWVYQERDTQTEYQGNVIFHWSPSNEEGRAGSASIFYLNLCNHQYRVPIQYHWVRKKCKHCILLTLYGCDLTESGASHTVHTAFLWVGLSSVKYWQIIRCQNDLQNSQGYISHVSDLEAVDSKNITVLCNPSVKISALPVNQAFLSLPHLCEALRHCPGCLLRQCAEAWSAL